MAIPRAFVLLNSLNQEEQKRFQDFLASPYHNKSQKLLDLYGLLLPHFPLPLDEEGETDEAESERILETLRNGSLFPKDNKAESSISNILSRFRGTLEDFFSFEEYNQESLNKSFHTLLGLSKRAGTEDFFLRNSDKFEKLLEKDELNSIPTSLLKLQLAEHRLAFSTIHADRADSFPLEEARKRLQEYALINHLRYDLSALNRQRLTGEEHELMLLEPLLSYLGQDKALLKVPLLALYYHMVCCYYWPEDESAFEALRPCWDAHIEGVGNLEASELYAAYINLHIARKRKGLQSLEDIFNLYRAAAAQGALVSGEAIQAGSYLNIVDVGLALCRAAEEETTKAEILKWLSTFLEEKRANLKGQIRENAWNMAQALIAYYQQDLKSAAKLLQAQSTDLMLELKRRVLLVKIYTELAEWDLCDSVRSSSYIFLHRKKAKFSEEKIEVWNSFFLLSKQLAQILSQPKASPEEWEKFAKKLNQSPHLESRGWLAGFIPK